MDQDNNFAALNAASRFPQGVEGYWRPAPEKNPEMAHVRPEYWDYPWPVVMDVEGYEKHLFMTLLKEMEESPFTDCVLYRGISMHRLKDGVTAGNAEFQRDGWRWPQGYMSYIEMGVLPSRAFYKFVTALDCHGLPSYGR